MIGNLTEVDSRREAKTLLEEFLCGYQNILLSRGISANEAVCKQNELIDEYAERIEQAIFCPNCGKAVKCDHDH